MFNPGPIEHPEIPIYLAGVNPRICRVAGEVAVGALEFTDTAPQWKTLIQDYRAAVYE